MTTKVKGYPFELVINGSAVLTDQIKSLDWVVRGAKLKEKIASNKIEEIKNKLSVLLQL
tara:strand:- start:721 stop:897 length:177 start_codon:yes stop_codon:yes gene_type:complete